MFETIFCIDTFNLFGENLTTAQLMFEPSKCLCTVGKTKIPSTIVIQKQGCPVAQLVEHFAGRGQRFESAQGNSRIWDMRDSTEGEKRKCARYYSRLGSGT